MKLKTMEVHSFTNPRFGLLRAVEIGGLPWFVGTDVTEILQYPKGREAIREYVDEEDRATVLIHDDIGAWAQDRRAIVVNEAGLFALIYASANITAKAVKRWIAAAVLPALQQKDAPPAVVEAPRENSAMIIEDALRRMRRETIWIGGVAQFLCDQKYTEAFDNNPPAVIYNIIRHSDDIVTTGAIAAEYGISTRTLNEILRKLGVQRRVGKTWILSESYANTGFTVSKVRCENGVIKTILTCWTQKGRQMIRDLLEFYGIIPEAEGM
jgi:prophage antirepressor-like protein